MKRFSEILKALGDSVGVKIEIGKDLGMALTCHICPKFDYNGFFVIPVGL